MNVYIKDLGILKEANFEVGKLTVICGENNTGKTYATYAMYGFLHYWNSSIELDYASGVDVATLIKQGKMNIDTKSPNFDESIRKACDYISKEMAKVFGSSEKYFVGATISVTQNALASKDINETITMENPDGEALTLEVHKKKTDSVMQVNLKSMSPEVNENSRYSRFVIINQLIKNVLFQSIFPTPFIASIERTGAVMFQKELDIRRNQLLESISDVKEVSNLDIIRAVSDTRYALPVRHDVDFVRDLEYSSKFDSVISKNNPDIVKFFNSLVGGQYITSKEGTYFSPNKNKVRLTMGESASSIRSLLNLGMFIKHYAKPDSLLMIDEPELNLHPKNQRMIARLLARLVNAGVRVYITTHSDYIIREFNTLIMLKNKGEASRHIMEKYGYTEDEPLDMSGVKAYITRQESLPVEGAKRKQKFNVISSAKVDEHGIEIEEIDQTINLMNEINVYMIVIMQEVLTGYLGSPACMSSSKVMLSSIISPSRQIVIEVVSPARNVLRAAFRVSMEMTSCPPRSMIMSPISSPDFSPALPSFT